MKILSVFLKKFLIQKDVVYIGTINTKHFEAGMQAISHGKHILCEKPLCMNEKQSKKLLESARNAGVFCMEAVWTRFFPAFQYLREQITNGTLGEITEMEAALGHAGWGNVDRVRLKELGGGTILDLGVYSIQAALFVISDKLLSVTATGTLNSDSVDAEMHAELKFEGNKVAHVSCSGINSFHNNFIVRGSKGKIVVNSFWAPTSLIDVDGKRKYWKLPEAKHWFNFPNSCGLRFEAEEVRKCIEKGFLDSEIMPHEESLKIAKIEDECRKCIGVRYPEDDQVF